MWDQSGLSDGIAQWIRLIFAQYCICFPKPIQAMATAAIGMPCIYHYHYHFQSFLFVNYQFTTKVISRAFQINK